VPRATCSRCTLAGRGRFEFGETAQITSVDPDSLQLSGDRPKEHLADDRLGYAGFARSLARSIASLSPKEGIVFAINGPWGRGKTTAVNMIVEALADLRGPDQDGEVVPVRFNPWWFSEQENLVKAFFVEISASLEKKVSDQVAEGFRSIARRVASSKELVIAGLGMVPGAGAAKELAGAALGTLGALAGNNRSLSNLRDDLSDALRVQDKRLLVIIDDVDRLPPDEIRQIFRLVKSVADLPNVIHLLIFDRAIAERAFVGPADDLGPKWHEKIVQAAFDLPPVQRVDIHRMFFDGLNKLAGATSPSDQMRWANVFHDGIAPWLVTPRDARRLLNSLVVSWPPVARDADFADFVALETFRLFEPRLHTFIRNNPRSLTGLPHIRDKESRTKAAEDILATVEPEGRQRARVALDRLFPKLQSAWNNYIFDPDSLSEWDRDRRVCVERRFPAYFRFQIGDDALARDELERFLSKIADEDYVREKVTEYARVLRSAGGTKAAVLLDELSANVGLIGSNDFGKAAVNLFGVAGSFTNSHDDFKGAFPAIWNFWFLMKAILERLSTSARDEALRCAFANAKSFRGIGFALGVFRTSLGRDPEAEEPSGESPLVNAAVCEELEQIICARFRDSASDGTLILEEGLVQHLLQWRELEGETKVKAFTETLLNNDVLALALSKAATQMSHSLASGDRSSRERPVVHRPILEKIVDADKLIARLDAISADGCEPFARGVIDNFKLGLKNQSPFELHPDGTPR
jgi:predicted KAP-like P-loop ATPase